MIRVDRGKVVGRNPPATAPAPEQEPGSVVIAKKRPQENEVVDGLNLNTATAAQLSKAIAGVGPKTASDIIAHRKKAGPFESLEDCAKRVGGVSLAQLEAAKALV